MNLKLDKKVIMVAAASKGLGYGIARACAEDGAQLSIASRSRADIEAAARTISEECESKALGFVFDARDADSIQAWAKATKEEFGTIDGLVVNAGGPPTGTFDSFDDASWQNAFELTLLSSVRMIRAVLPEMKANKQGAILTITSSSVREPIAQLLLSNVFRSGVASLAKSLAKELGPHGIRINNLVPGRIDTDRVKSLDAGLAAARSIPPEEIKSEFEQAIPIGRYGSTKEFGQAGAFLLSDSASYISGSTLLIDGAAARSIW